MTKKTKVKSKLKKTALANFAEPKFIAEASSSPSLRRNRAATIDETDKYIHLESGLNPFHQGSLMIDIERTVRLCQSAYYNVGIIRNTIEIMTELCDSRIFMQGGNTVSCNFIDGWLKRINLESLKEQFFREYHRSGNIFLYRFDAKFNTNDAKEISKIYGAQVQADVVDKLEKIPIRYIFLNPALIRTSNTVIYQNSQYFQMLTPMEIARLKFPKTSEDQQLFDSLDPETKDKIKSNILPYIPLDQNRLYPVFAKKQDYEPFATPFIFPVLEQVNAHLELQKVDQALARTLDRAILLITNGAKPEDGGISPMAIAALQNLLKSESVTRTLVADYTTKGEWLIPDLSKILGPDKYTELNRQINNGLNAIFFDDDSNFSTASVKTQIFLERLAAPRKRFLNFLQNEVNRVCDVMNFKQYPQLFFEDIQLKDQAEFVRLYTRMTELGLLTPNQFFNAIDTGELPDINTPEYLAEIEEYKNQRDKGLFLPLVGASLQDPNGQAPTAAPGQTQPGKPNIPQTKSVPKSPGRPNGTKAPQLKKKKQKPLGLSKGISMSALRDTAEAGAQLIASFENGMKKHYKIKELNDNQKHLCNLLSQSVMLNEEREQWPYVIKDYIKKMKSPSEDKANQVEALAAEHGLSLYEATLLYLSNSQPEKKV